MYQSTSGFKLEAAHFHVYYPKPTTTPKQKQAPPTWLAYGSTYMEIKHKFLAATRRVFELHF